MEFKLRTNARYFNDKDVLLDLKRVADLLKKDTVSQQEYIKHGKFSFHTFYNRFGSWNKALKAAGISLGRFKNISDKELFENLEIL
ncbi:MAG: hypothetical protein WCX69_02575 [Candidatus Paceibacterota bacterium]